MLSRRKARENAFIALFEASFGGELDEIIAYGRAEAQEHAVDEYGENLLRLYTANAEAVDGAIQANLKGWTVNRLVRVNLALLRLAVAEMEYGEPGMDSVVINEAVEIAKKYGDEADYQFVNGLLGSVSRARGGTPPEKEAAGAAPAGE